jgi:hypothetical protein
LMRGGFLFGHGGATYTCNKLSALIASDTAATSCAVAIITS